MNLKVGDRAVFRAPGGTADEPPRYYAGEIVSVGSVIGRYRIRGFNFGNVEGIGKSRRWGVSKVDIIEVDPEWLFGTDQERDVCNLHGLYLVETSAKFTKPAFAGSSVYAFYRCPLADCSVGKWGSPFQSKSKPADGPTRALRKQLLESLKSAQSNKYAELCASVSAEIYEIDARAGIGGLNAEECERILGFFKECERAPLKEYGLPPVADAAVETIDHWGRKEFRDERGYLWRELEDFEEIHEGDRISFYGGEDRDFVAAPFPVRGIGPRALREHYPDFRAIRLKPATAPPNLYNVLQGKSSKWVDEQLARNLRPRKERAAPKPPEEPPKVREIEW